MAPWLLLASLVAQFDSFTMVSFGTIVQTVGGLSAFGLIAWLVRRVFTHTIPRLAQDFKDALAAQSKLLITELKLARELYERDAERQRLSSQTELTHLREDFKVEIQREREFFADQLAHIKRRNDTILRSEG